MAESSQARARSFADFAHALWGWWVSELAGAIREDVRRAFGSAPIETLVLQAGLEIGAGVDRNRGRYGAPLRLIVASDAVLTLERKFPFEVIDSLDAVFRADIDRLTPYAASEVAFGWRIVAYDWRDRILHVACAVVRRKEIERLRSQLSQRGAGERGADLWIDDLCIAIPIAPARLRAATTRRRLMSAAMSLGLAVLAVFVLALPSIRMGAVAEHWEQESKRLETLASRTTQEAIEAEHHRRRVERLNVRLPEEIAAFDILSELSTILPPGSWLDSLKIESKQIQIVGLSRDASEVVSRLGASTKFSDLSYRSPIGRDAQTGLSRFDLVARPAPAKPQ